MTDRQKKFAAQYVQSFNYTAAATAAGYSQKTASSQGLKLLKNPKVLADIESRLKEKEEKNEDIKEEIIKELAKIAFSNYSDFIKIINQQEYREVWDEEEQTNVKVLCDVKVAEPILTDVLSHEQQSAIRSIKTDRYGVKIETYDKVKALELLGKHLGMFKDSYEMPKDKEEQKSLAKTIEDAYKKRMEGKQNEDD